MIPGTAQVLEKSRPRGGSWGDEGEQLRNLGKWPKQSRVDQAHGRGNNFQNGDHFLWINSLPVCSRMLENAWYGLGFHNVAPGLQNLDSRTYPIFSRGQRHAKNSLWDQWHVVEETEHWFLANGEGISCGEGRLSQEKGLTELCPPHPNRFKAAEQVIKSRTKMRFSHYWIPQLTDLSPLGQQAENSAGEMD